jgi:hypothetical protein
MGYKVVKKTISPQINFRLNLCADQSKMANDLAINWLQSRGKDYANHHTN